MLLRPLIVDVGSMRTRHFSRYYVKWYAYETNWQFKYGYNLQYRSERFIIEGWSYAVAILIQSGM